MMNLGWKAMRRSRKYIMKGLLIEAVRGTKIV